MTDIKERLREESLRLARHSFDSVDAGLAANVADAALDEIEKLEKALQCEHLWARQDEIGRPYCAACGMAWSVVRRIADPVGKVQVP